MPYICVVKSHLCTPYVYVIKGSPVHPTSVSLRVHLCTYYVRVVKGSPVHRTFVLLRVISVHLLLRCHLIKLNTPHRCVAF